MPGRGAGGGGGLRLIPGKALFFRREAQTNCREEAPAADGVCAPFRCGFAPHSPESLISPLRGANLLPGRGASGRVSLRLTPGKALFFRQEAQTFYPEKAPAVVGVCAPYPGKSYSTVERRKPFTRKRRRRPREFAPHTSESLILPLRGANFLQGKGAGGRWGLRLIPGKALFHR